MADAITDYVDLDDQTWVKATDGQTFVCIQVNSSGRVRVRVRPNTEDPNDLDPPVAGLTLARGIEGIESAFTAGNLPDGTAVWLLADRNMDADAVVVMAY
jgi:hypothetical protein